jgi:hypothetical protein
MPTVEYTKSQLIVEVEQETVEDSNTTETVTRTVERPKHPFEVRLSKWVKRSDGYHIHGFVEVTEFGQTLASQSTPWTWVNDTYTVADGLTENNVTEMVNGVQAVENAHLDAILDFGNVEPVSAEVTSEEGTRFDFEIVLDGSETFDIKWLTVDFDPNRGGD